MSGNLQTSVVTSFGRDSIVGVTIEVLDSNSDSPMKEVVVYSRDPYQVKVLTGYFTEAGTYSNSVVDFVSFDGTSTEINNPKAFNVVIDKLEPFYSQEASIVYPNFSYSYFDNSVVSDKNCIGGLIISYDYEGDKYQVDLSDSPSINGSRQAIFLVFATHIKEDGSVVILKDSVTLSWSKSEGPEIVVEEWKPDIVITDPTIKEFHKYVDVFCETSFLTRITSGSYTNRGTAIKKVKEFVTVNGQSSVKVALPNTTLLDFKPTSNIYDEEGNVYSKGWVYSPDIRSIVAVESGKYYGAFEIDYSARSTRFLVNLENADLVDTTTDERKALFYGIALDTTGTAIASASLSWSTSKSDGGFSEKNQEKAKDSSGGMVIQEFPRYAPIVKSDEKKVYIHFEVTPVPNSGMRFLLENVESVQVVSVSTNSAGVETLSYSAPLSPGQVFERNPEQLFKVYKKKILNFVNQGNHRLDFLPEALENKNGSDPITTYPAFDFFGTPITISVRKPGDKIKEASWKYDNKTEKMYLVSEGIERIVAPDEIVLVDSDNRMIPCVTQVLVEYSVMQGYFLAGIKMVDKPEGTDFSKWVQRDSFVYVSGVHNFDIYPIGDPENVRRLSGNWNCTSLKYKEQDVERKPKAVI